MSKLYPRLESFEYEEKIQLVEKQLANGQNYFYSANDSDLQWLPVGDRAEPKEIEDLRFKIISFMHSENLNPVASAQDRTVFDRKLGLKLRRWLDITPSIAADNGMWAYMNIVLVPDLIKVRWGYTEKGEERQINHERYYDTNRSYLKKLWFTAYLINDEELYKKLKQDEIDVWYDRAFNRGLDNYIQQIYKSFYWNLEKYKINSEFGDLYRQFLKLLNRKLAYINYYALNEDNMQTLLDGCFQEIYEEAKITKENLAVLNTEPETSEQTENKSDNGTTRRKVVIVKRKTENEKKVQDLRRQDKSHSLTEDFENSEPIGFIFGGIAFANTNSWAELYKTFMSFCVKKLPDTMKILADNPHFYSKSGRIYFSKSEENLRKAAWITDDFYIETNLSANFFVRLIILVLHYLKIPLGKFEIYLKQ